MSFCQKYPEIPIRSILMLVVIYVVGPFKAVRSPKKKACKGAHPAHAAWEHGPERGIGSRCRMGSRLQGSG